EAFRRGGLDLRLSNCAEIAARRTRSQHAALDGRSGFSDSPWSSGLLQLTRTSIELVQEMLDDACTIARNTNRRAYFQQRQPTFRHVHRKGGRCDSGELREVRIEYVRMVGGIAAVSKPADRSDEAHRRAEQQVGRPAAQGRGLRRGAPLRLP